MCPTHGLTAEAISPNPALTRLDRCFITGSNQDTVRQHLRVLAGVRQRDGDPERLEAKELKALLDACPPQCRSVHHLPRQHVMKMWLRRPWLEKIASRRQITSENPAEISPAMKNACELARDLSTESALR